MLYYISKLKMNIITQQLKFHKKWLKSSQKFSINRFISSSNANRTEDRSKPEAFEVQGPKHGRPDPNPPIVYANANIQEVPKFIEKPFLYHRMKERKHREQKHRQIVHHNDKNKAKKMGLSVEMQNKKQHPSIKLALELLSNATEKGSQMTASKNWRPKPPVDYVNEYFLKNQAHLLGLSKNELQNRFDFLNKLGLERTDSLTVALHFPSSLNLNSCHVENLAKLYSTYKVNLVKLFVMYPFVFSLSVEDVAKRLEHLGTAGLKKKEVGDLINTNPLMLCFGLNESSKESLKFCSGLSGWKSSSGKSMFIEAIVKSSLTERAVKYEFNEMFESITSFLEQLQVPVSNVFKRCPEFFSSDMETIYRVMHYLTDAPFFFDIEALSKFIHKYPGIYLQLDKEETKLKIKKVQDILGDESELYEIMQATPRMFTHSLCLESRIALFLTWNFTSKQIAFLMKRFPLFFYDNRVVENLGERLDFLLGNKDLTCNQIMKFPSCLQMRIAVLTCKIGYIRKYKPDALKTRDLQTIFTLKEEDFAVELCSTNLKLYHEYIEENFSTTDAKMVKKNGSTQRRKNVGQK